MWDMVMAGVVTVLAMGVTIAIVTTVCYWVCEFLETRDQSERNQEQISRVMSRIQDLEYSARVAREKLTKEKPK